MSTCQAAEDRQHSDDADQRRQNPAQQRQIAIGPLLQQGIAAQEILIDHEEALEADPQQGQRQPGENQDQDGEAGAAPEIGEAAGHIRRPGDIDRQQIDQRQDMPGMGELLAQPREIAQPVVSLPRAMQNHLRHAVAALQDQRRQQEGPDQPQDLQRQLIGRIRQPQQDRDLEHEIAVDGERDQPLGPDVEIGGRLVAEGKQPQRGREGAEQESADDEGRARDHHRADDGEQRQAHGRAGLDHGDHDIGRDGEGQDRQQLQRAMGQQQPDPAEGARLHHRAQMPLAAAHVMPGDEIDDDADPQDQGELPEEFEQQSAPRRILDLEPGPVPETRRVADTRRQLLETGAEAPEGIGHGLEKLGAQGIGQGGRRRGGGLGILLGRLQGLEVGQEPVAGDGILEGLDQMAEGGGVDGRQGGRGREAEGPAGSHRRDLLRPGRAWAGEAQDQADQTENGEAQDGPDHGSPWRPHMKSSPGYPLQRRQ